MRNSVIIHPPCERFIIIRKWQLALCENKAGCAALLSFLEHSYNYAAERFYELRELENERNLTENESDLLSLGTWRYFTDAALEKGILIYSADTLRSAVKFLVEKGFVSDNPPAELKKKFKTGGRKWLKINPEAINKAISAHHPESFDNPHHPATSDNPELNDNPLAVKKQSNNSIKIESIKEIFRFWQIIHQHPQAVCDNPRTAKIKNALQSGFSFAQILQAVIGNTFSEFHQGIGQGIKGQAEIYDDIKLILRDASQIERFCRFAEENDVTAEIALNDYENIKSGEQSKFAKKPKTSAVKLAKVKDASARSGKSEKVPDAYRPYLIKIAKAVAAKNPFHSVMDTVIKAGKPPFLWRETALRQGLTAETAKLTATDPAVLSLIESVCNEIMRLQTP